MLVILTENQVLEPQRVCTSCLLATHEGQPRLNSGHPCCGKALHKGGDRYPTQYQCAMGFRLAEIA
ncbi:MAG: hypothetical protein AAGF24_02340 [Cyanobacteria bacterium P01_H01_bin.121]